MDYDVIVIGGGPAGMAAAHSARRSGAKTVRVLEREGILGGILNQCIHNGFGLHYFQEELTGPEYAERFLKMLAETDVELSTGTTVLRITRDRQVHAVSPTGGYEVLQAKSIVLAMGCRERTRGALCIPGARPAGIFTAGTAQRYVNIEGHMVGRRVVILGSGDIGLIMARRMTLEGATVLACVEVQPYPGGLTRNLVQCLEDFDIPLFLSHTVVDVQGRARLEQVTIAQVDATRTPIPGTEQTFSCDTLLLSVGLIPENELAREAEISLDSRTGGAVVSDDLQTDCPGIFACGNALHVHDLVDYVTLEAQRAGAAAARFAKTGQPQQQSYRPVQPGHLIGYVVPQRLCLADGAQSYELFFRVTRPIGTCTISVRCGDRLLFSQKKIRMMPGEMEKLLVPAQSIPHDTLDSLTISVQEAAI